MLDKHASKSVQFNMRDPVHILAVGFGSGLSPKAPGTVGTLAAVPIWYFLFAGQSDLVYGALVLVTALVGIYLCDKCSKDIGVHDHGGIVWDEFVGFFITMWAVPATWGWILIGFILFRFFDILKPPPIKQVDRQLKGGLGIMMDDIIAGVMAWLVIQLLMRVI